MSFYLCKPDGTILGHLTGIRPETVSLKKNVLDTWELTFEVERYEFDGETEQLVQSVYYDSVDEMMRIYQDDEQVYYVIDSEPSINIDGKQEFKTVTAHSCEVELVTKFLSNFKVNCGTQDSLEYLAIDQNGEQYNIDPYTKLPKQYIKLVNYDDPQLSLLHLALENTGWEPDSNIPSEISERLYSFESNDNVYTFIMKQLATTAELVPIFDRRNRRVSFEALSEYGTDSGVFIGYRNLLKSVDITTSNTDNLVTKMYVTGADNLSILYVNFGQNYILNYDYFMNEGNEYGDYKFVTEALHDKYEIWKEYRDEEIVSFNTSFENSNGNTVSIDYSYSYYEPIEILDTNGDVITQSVKKTISEGTRRQLYAAMTKKYNQLTLDINELVNRLPNDGCNIDYTTWKYEELRTALIAYQNAWTALVTLYKNDIRVKYNIPNSDTIYLNYLPHISKIYDAIGNDVTNNYTLDEEEYTKDTVILKNKYNIPSNYIVVVSNPDYSLKVWDSNGNDVTTTIPFAAEDQIQKSMYWNDFYSYQEILQKVEEALKCWCKTDDDGYFQFDANGNFIYLENGNPIYYNNEDIVKAVDEWLYEWSLYGLDELESKRKAWNEKAAILFDDCFIVDNSDPEHPVYREANNDGWNSLTAHEKLNFTSEGNYINKLNAYLDYMSLDVTRLNGITGKIEKGIIRQCQDAIDMRKAEIDNITSIRNDIQEQRNQLANFVMLENFEVNGDKLFTKDDLLIIGKFTNEYSYENPNYLLTNLNDIVSAIDVQEELYQDAYARLYEISQPQYSFQTDISNLLQLEEFESAKNTFVVGNYIHVGVGLYDNYWIKLRLVSITTNPMIITNEISVEFATATKSLNGISDLAYFLGDIAGGSGSSGGSSSGSGGTYGTNDAQIQIANNMLNAMLSTELFGTEVRDVILDSIKANKGNFNVLFAHSGLFDNLEVRGDAVFGGLIKSLNYLPYISDAAPGQGSMLNLNDGSFTFGAGSLRFDTTHGLIIKDSLGLTTSSIESSNYNTGLISGKHEGSKINLYDGSFDFAGSLMFDPNNGLVITSPNGMTTAIIKSSNYNGTNNQIDNTIGSILRLDDGQFNFGGVLKWNGSDLNIGDKFKYENLTGKLTIQGDITADTLIANKTGSIAGWSFNSSCFYKNYDTLGTKDGIYLGMNGFSVSDYFVVDQDGVRLDDKNNNVFRYLNQIVLNGDYYHPFVLYNNTQGTVTFYINNIKRLLDNSDKILQIRMDTFSVTNSHPMGIDGSVFWSIRKEDVTYQGYDEYYKTDLYSCSGSLNYFFYNDLDRAYPTNIVIYITDDKFTTYYSESGLVFFDVNINYSDGTTFSKRFDNPTHSYTPFDKSSLSMKNHSLNFAYSKMSDEGISIYTDNVVDDTSINGYHIISDQSAPEQIYKISRSNLIHKGLKRTSGGSTLKWSDGNFLIYESSSERYKEGITTEYNTDLDPKRLYALPVKQYEYVDGYLYEEDQRAGKPFIGFIAEDIYQYYPFACDLNKEGKPENPNFELMIPPMLKLIQEQHELLNVIDPDVNTIQQDIINIKEKNTAYDKKLLDLNSKDESFEGSIEENTIAINELIKDKNTINTNIESITDDVTILQTDSANLLSEVNNLKALFKELNEELSWSKEYISELQDEVAVLKEKINILENNVKPEEEE